MCHASEVEAGPILGIVLLLKASDHDNPVPQFSSLLIASPPAGGWASAQQQQLSSSMLHLCCTQFQRAGPCRAADGLHATWHGLHGGLAPVQLGGKHALLLPHMPPALVSALIGSKP